MNLSQAKRAGEILSIIFDERLVKKAQGYSRLFAFWPEAVRKNGIAAAADHSRIKELDRGILLIEADHPGWKQILQTKQSQLLNDFRYQFPEENICGISLILSRNEPQTDNPELAQKAEEITPVKGAMPSCETENVCMNTQRNTQGYENIKDEEFKATLKRLEQSIATKGLNKEKAEF